MPRTARGRRKSRTVSVGNLSEIETRTLVPEGDYRVEVKELSLEEGDKAQYIKWVFEVDDKKVKGNLYLNTSLADQALWKLKQLLEALQIDIPEEPLDLDLDEIEKDAPAMMCSVEHEKYEGSKQARITDFWEEESGKGKEKEKETRRGKGKDKENNGRRRSSKDKEEVTEAKIKDMDQEELEDFVKEYKLDIDLDDFPTLRKKAGAAIDAAEKEGILAD